MACRDHCGHFYERGKFDATNGSATSVFVFPDMRWWTELWQVNGGPGKVDKLLISAACRADGLFESTPLQYYAIACSGI